MKKNKKILSSLLLLTTASLAYSSSPFAACTATQLAADASTFNSINFGPSSVSFSLCGQSVTLSSNQSLDNASDLSGLLGAALVTNGGQGNTVSVGIPITLAVNGTTIFSGTTFTAADATAFLQALGFIFSQNLLSATSLASTSASSKVSDTVFHNIISPSIQTRSQQQKQQDRPMQKLIIGMADLKYEHAEFTDTNDSGNIGGFTASGSYELNKSFSVGAIIPYDHMAFNSFDADRTGTILYVKNTLKLPSNFELNTAVNGNYMYTAMQFNGISGTTQLHTYGGGISTRLKFDHLDSNFIPSAAFSYQYNKDSTNIQDNQQHLLKVGPALGYRVLDNATLQVSGSWTKDISQYQTLKNGNDYYDVGLEGAWVISDAWQLRGGYKKILGLTNFESDSIYLGSALRF